MANTKPHFDPTKVKQQLNRWILTELSHTIDSVTQGIESYKFNEASLSAYQFIWHKFCDWYVELLKPVFFGDDESAKMECRSVSRYALDEIYKILHPFMPFMTEELWRSTSSSREKLLCHTGWSLPIMNDESAASEINWLIEIVGGVRSLRSEMNIKPALPLPLFVMSDDKSAKKKLEGMHDSIIKLAKLGSLEWTDAPIPESVHIILDNSQLFLPLKGVVDFSAERVRLEKELVNLRDDSAKIEKNLLNDNFVANAPVAVVEKNRNLLADIGEKVEKIEVSLSKLADLD